MSNFNNDPFENGWASNDGARDSDSYHYANANMHASLAFLTSSQLLHANEPQSPQTVDLTNKVPDQYRVLFERYGSQLNGASDLEAAILQPLIDHDLLSSRQGTKITDTLYDHNLLPPLQPLNFYQALGLLSLELSLPGLGDYVSLQFRLHLMLPALPEAAASVLLKQDEQEDEVDETSRVLASSSIAEPEERNDWDNNTDPLLADHSDLQLDPDTTIPESTHVNDFPYLSRYVADIRERFSPVIGLGELVSIKEVPEKEGLLFKHINYVITHEINLGTHSARGPKKVVRRYSDFAWLLEFLLNKYPFRVIPGLPPKKFSGTLS